MRRAALWTRLARRARREWEGFLHTRADRTRVAAVPSLLSRAERADLIARLGQTPEVSGRGLVLPGGLAERLSGWAARHPEGSARIAAEAAGLMRDELAAFGRVYRIGDPRSWCRDPLRPSPWPLRPHARLLLNDPQTPGDVRMQWEPARFHHAPALARLGLVSGSGESLAAFLRQTDSFDRGNPPYDSIHWAVGMEVGIRAAAWILALDCFRCSSPLSAADAQRLLDSLLLHGAFLQAHPDRHPDGFTTNHTVAAAAGLAVVGRCLDASAIGRSWRETGGRRLAECLRTQVLSGGAHAEGALPYQRFVLEAALVGFLCLEAAERTLLRGPLEAMARHLSDARLADELPFVGDGDDSFFPPFGLAPFDERNPLDPEAVLQAAEAVLGLSGLRRRPATEEAALWLGAAGRAEPGIAPASARVLARGAEPGDPAGGPAQPDAGQTPPPGSRAAGRGFLRWSAGAFEGGMIARGAGEGWVATHAHNDLLSLVISVDGTPLLIDPGTHGYAVDRELRHCLRSTAAHSTLQFEDREQSPLRPDRLFHGPIPVPCGAAANMGGGLRLMGWHDGFRDDRTGAVVRHTRALRWQGGTLWITDTLDRLEAQGTGLPEPGAGQPAGRTARRISSGESRLRSTLRFRLAPGLTPCLERIPRPSTSPRRVCRIPFPGGTVAIFALRPADARWQIVPGVVSRRYARRCEAAILEGTTEAHLPHRWRVAWRFEPAP